MKKKAKEEVEKPYTLDELDETLIEVINQFYFTKQNEILATKKINGMFT